MSKDYVICNDTLFKLLMLVSMVSAAKRFYTVLLQQQKSLILSNNFQRFTNSTAKMPIFKRVTHVIFDLDGLILDTEKLYAQVAQEICGAYNKHVDAEFRENNMGLTGVEYSEQIVNAYNLPITPEEYVAKAKIAYNRLFPTAQCMPDTESIYFKIYKDIAAKYKQTYPKEVREKLMGTSEQDSARTMVDGLSLPITAEQFLEEQHKQEKSSLPSGKLMPGSDCLIRHLYKHGIPIAIATSSGKQSVELKATNHKELFSLFHHIVPASSDPEVKRGKPNPDVFLVCASRFPDKPQPEMCLVLEDAPNGVQAAIAAGMQVVMVPDPNLSESKRKGATQVITSLEHFKPEEYGLPPF